MTPKYNVRRQVHRFFCREWHRRPNISHVMKNTGENIKISHAPDIYKMQEQ